MRFLVAILVCLLFSITVAWSYQPGDCNGSGALDAGDLTSVIMEIFDGDGFNAADTLGGTFPGNPACDANVDGVVDAADITCTYFRIFGYHCG